LSTLSKWLRLERDAVPAKVKFREVRLANPLARWPVAVVGPEGWIVRLPPQPIEQGMMGPGLLAQIADGQDHPDQRVHTSGVGRGQDRTEIHHSGGMNLSLTDGREFSVITSHPPSI
jgi:hypothetical protein